MGTELGCSDWELVDQDRIDEFAWATGDHYWIHTDADRVAQSGRAATIAHGLLTLALGPMLTYSLIEVSGFAATFNYGFEKVRFTAPVAVSSRIRLRLSLERLEESDRGVKAYFRQTFEVEEAERPACVATSVWYFER